MAGLTRLIKDLVSAKGIDPARVAGYQVAALEAADRAALTVWTREGVNRAGEVVLQKHEFILDESGPPAAATVSRPAGWGTIARRRPVAVALRRRVA